MWYALLLVRRGLGKKAAPYRGPLAASVGAAVSALAFVLYLKTLAPTVLYYDLPTVRDAPILQVKAAVLGIPDYTGYPTWVMLGKLFTYLPVGDVAYRVNLSSAVYAALAVFFVYLIGFLVTRRPPAAAAGALAFGASKAFWSQAVIAEVYTLNALLASIALFVLLLWRDRRRDRYLLLAAFFMGFCLTDHVTSGVLIPAGFVFVFLVDRSRFRDVGLVLKGVGLFLLGLLPYAYIPIRASMDYLPKGFIWGQPLIRVYPPNTLYGFYNLVSGGQWKSRMFAFGPGELPGRFLFYLGHLLDQFGRLDAALALVAVLGVLYLLREDRKGVALLGVPFAGWLFYALEYDIEDIYYYFIPTYLVLAVFMAAGFDALLGGAERLAARLPSPAAAIFPVLLSVVILAAPLVGAPKTYGEVDRSGDYRGRELMDTVAKKVGHSASVLTHRSPLYYMLLVQHRREDITLINYIEDPREKEGEKVKRALKHGPVYYLFPGKENTQYYLGVNFTISGYRDAGYKLIAIDKDALLYQVVKDKRRTDGP